MNKPALQAYSAYRIIMKRISKLIVIFILLITTFTSCIEITDTQTKVEKENPLLEIYPQKDKAVIILPGIMGSELYSEKEYNGILESKVLKDQLIWMPQDVSSLLSSVSDFEKPDSSIFTVDAVKSLTFSFMMLSNYSNGESIYRISPVIHGNNDSSYGTLGSYTNLYNKINDKFSADHDIIFYSYDWRMPVRDIAFDLSDFIYKCGYNEVNFVAHSMGGLVVSHYLSISLENQVKTNRVITVGTPFGGSVRALSTLQKGRYFDFPLADIPIRELVYNMSSLYELLPTVNYLEYNEPYIYNNNKPLNIDQTDEFIKSNAKASDKDLLYGLNNTLYENSLKSHEQLIKNGDHIINDQFIDVHMIVGYNTETPESLYESDFVLKEMQKTFFGDGTVGVNSSAFYNGELFDNPIYFINGVSHGSLVKDSDSIDLIILLLEKGETLTENDYNLSKISDYENISLNNDDTIDRIMIETEIKIPFK